VTCLAGEHGDHGYSRRGLYSDALHTGRPSSANIRPRQGHPVLCFRGDTGYEAANECTRAAANDVDSDDNVLQVMGSAWLVVRFCLLTDTYGPGCSFLGETHSYVESCLFQVMSLIQKDALKDSHVKSCLFQDDISPNKIKSSLHTDGACRAFSRGQPLARPLTTRPRSR